jgi:hypothetical protein
VLVAAIGHNASASPDRCGDTGALTVARKLTTDNACIETSGMPAKSKPGARAKMQPPE